MGRLRSAVLLGLLLRAAVFAVGWAQDNWLRTTVRFEDIDYGVFSDGAAYLTRGCPLDQALAVDASDAWHDRSVYSPLKCDCAVGPAAVLARLVLQRDPALWEGKDLAAQLEQGGLVFRIVLGSYSLFRPVFCMLARVGDPFARQTYRYTPLLALLVALAQAPGRDGGKVAFLLADLAVGVLLWRIVDLRAASLPSELRAQEMRRGHRLVRWVWLANPLPAQIAARGSAESVIALVVLAFVYAFLLSNPEAPPGWRALQGVYDWEPSATGETEARETSDRATQNTLVGQLAPGQNADRAELESRKKPSEMAEHIPTDTDVAPAPDVDKGEPNTAMDSASNEADDGAAFFAPEASEPLWGWSVPGVLAPVLLAGAVHLKIYPAVYAAPVAVHLYLSSCRAGHSGVSAVLRWGVVCAIAFVLITGAVWAVWGTPYLEHSWLYHLTRIDHRHNFSPYFLPIYLSSVYSSPLSALPGTMSPLLSFAPQMLAVAASAILSAWDVPLALLVGTHAFVHLNKVLTSQYFLWYLTLLPIVLPRTQWTVSRAILALTIWLGSQALWLAAAHQLENHARDTYVLTWALGVVMVLANALVATWVLQSWRQWHDAHLALLIGEVKAMS